MVKIGLRWRLNICYHTDYKNEINKAKYVKGDKTTNIPTYGINKNENFVIDYPFEKHPVYYK